MPHENLRTQSRILGNLLLSSPPADNIKAVLQQIKLNIMAKNKS